ncbi:MAG TPA: hypothetical protein VHC97_09310 [Thermoanaerobaculia bacterium]|jgi:hypothetical protein|nr:hypothetical protein [Thermoanaerobaculia bacterium]
MSLLDPVVAVLRSHGISFALAGASALAAHGVVRSTVDQDLFVMDSLCLDPSLWLSIRDQGITVEVQKGDLFDPLAGVVRFERSGERPLDVVVGKYTWQREVLQRASVAPGTPETSIPLVRAADLILLKLYAGGPQDAWDIQQLLAGEDRETLIAEVDRELPRLTSESAALWKKILEG